MRQPEIEGADFIARRALDVPHDGLEDKLRAGQMVRVGKAGTGMCLFFYWEVRAFQEHDRQGQSITVTKRVFVLENMNQMTNVKFFGDDEFDKALFHFNDAIDGCARALAMRALGIGD